MLIWFLAQAPGSGELPIAPQDRALVMLLLIVALLGLGILLVIELLAAWRNLIQRQRDLEMAHEEREADLPHPDAWQTAGQRLETSDVDPGEAHLSPGLDADNGFTHTDNRNPDAQGPDLDEDDFPFGDDDEDDDDEDDGDDPIGRP